MLNRLLLLTLILIFGCQPAKGALDDPDDDSTGWKAGVSKVNITPERSIWMAGYAARDRPSEGTLHDLWVKALALEDETGKQSVLVTADLIGFPKDLPDRIRDRVEEMHDLSRAQIILNSSHTHTGPEVRASRYQYQLEPEQLERTEQYTERLERNIVAVIDEAIQSLKPARLYSENGVVRFAVNRRNNEEATLHEQTELAGPSDHAVPVIKVENASGELMAVAFGYACHPTVLSFYEWSGDYPGFAQIELEKAYPGATALFFQGAGGDQNPLPRRTVELAEQYGRELAAAVQRVMNEEMRLLEPQLAVAYSEVELGFMNPPPDEEELLSILDDSDYPEWQKDNARALLDKLRQGESLMTSYAYPVQVWKLGDQPIVALGGELLVDYAIQIKRILGDETFVLGYSNDVMAYLPPARVVVEGGYEGDRSPVFTTPWSPDIEVKILHEVVRLAEETDL